jgi:AhpD family alkylhydroperoxidase
MEMTMDATTPVNTSPVKFEQEIPNVVQALQQVHKVMGGYELDHAIANLVHIRASQINGCAHCIKMHVKEAREAGETNDRLDRLVVWRHVHDFNAREKAALAWTEALTTLNQETDLARLRAELRQHFSDKEISVLTAEVGMINMWNRMAISRH